MAKYIIDIPEKGMMYLNVWKYEDGKCVWTDTHTPSDLKPYTASKSYIDGLNKGQKEVWDFVRIITDMTECERKECFGGSTCDLDEYMTYQEAKAKYEAWKKKEEEIRVGDEVIPLDTQYDTMVVTKLWTGAYRDEWADAIAGDGKLFSFLKTSIKKTGRHFPEVDELLKKMRG